MNTSSTTPSFTNAVKILTRATKADKQKEWKSASNLYTEAFEEFNKQLQPYYDSLTAIKKKNLNLESTTTHTAVFALGPVDLPPKFCPVKTSDVKLNDAGGPEVCKEVLREATIWPKKYDHFFTGKLLLHHCGFSNLCFQLVYLDVLKFQC